MESDTFLLAPLCKGRLCYLTAFCGMRKRRLAPDTEGVILERSEGSGRRGVRHRRKKGRTDEAVRPFGEFVLSQVTGNFSIQFFF